MRETRGLCAAIALAALVGLLVGCNGSRAPETRGAALDAPEQVSVEDVERWMAEGRDLVILDSRSDIAWERGSTRAAGAIRVPPNDVESAIDEIPREGTVIVYCT